MKKSIVKKAYSAVQSPRKTSTSTTPKVITSVKSLKKQYLKSDNNMCKVTFRLPKDAAQDAEMVTIVGDFNNWSVTENEMKKLKNGDFTLTLELPCNREYKFRYLIDANRWENDWFADKYVPNAFGADDSVVII
ncbi:MAG: isoamylase early set domain-containing protein [Nitrospirae bacterium]|nr:isoamylase early set domain-containing protein [Nitrospirota bacterium]